jgi:hypothetical protein
MKTVRVLLLGIAAALGACHQESGTANQPKAAPRANVSAVAKKGPTAEQLTAGMVEAAAVGKSQLPVRLKFELKQRPVIGRPLDIDIAVMPQIDASAAAVQVTGGDGLSVAPGAKQVDLPAVEADQVYRQTVTVTATTDGVLLLGLTVSLKHDEMTDSRAFSIPLIVDR